VRLIRPGDVVVLKEIASHHVPFYLTPDIDDDRTYDDLVNDGIEAVGRRRVPTKHRLHVHGVLTFAGPGRLDHGGRVERARTVKVVVPAGSLWSLGLPGEAWIVMFNYPRLGEIVIEHRFMAPVIAVVLSDHDGYVMAMIDGHVGRIAAYWFRSDAGRRLDE